MQISYPKLPVHANTKMRTVVPVFSRILGFSEWQQNTFDAILYINTYQILWVHETKYILIEVGVAKLFRHHSLTTLIFERRSSTSIWTKRHIKIPEREHRLVIFRNGFKDAAKIHGLILQRIKSSPKNLLCNIMSILGRRYLIPLWCRLFHTEYLYQIYRAKSVRI